MEKKSAFELCERDKLFIYVNEGHKHDGCLCKIQVLHRPNYATLLFENGQIINTCLTGWVYPLLNEDDEENLL